MELGELLLSAALAGLLSSLGVQDLVPPPEAGSVVANELLVVEIVVVGTGPEGEEVPQAPREVVTAVGIDGLDETEENPRVHGEEVEVVGEVDPDGGRADGAETENHDFDGRRVLGGETEGSRVVVVELVDGLIERAVVKRPMGEIVPGILHDEEDADLVGHLPHRGERHAIVHSAPGRDGMEEPDLREFDGEVAEEDNESAVSLFLQAGSFQLSQKSWLARSILWRKDGTMASLRAQRAI